MYRVNFINASKDYDMMLFDIHDDRTKSINFGI
jgi:hypothetical protein